jgi:2,3-bisphosphoglycerate-independent phosphoglycerate mutase
MVDENIYHSQIEEDDVVIFFNFRTDRGRELTEVLTQMDCHEQNMHKLNLYYVTLTNDETYQNIKVVYNKDNITETLGEVLEKANASGRQRNIRMLLFFLSEVESSHLLAKAAS